MTNQIKVKKVKKLKKKKLNPFERKKKRSLKVNDFKRRDESADKNKIEYEKLQKLMKEW